MIIDATNLVLGRLASFAAKKALNGEEISIVNAEKAVVTGNKKEILKKYKFKRDVGDPVKGPFVSRMPDRLVRRTIRGMLPRKSFKGKEAFKKIKVYIGTSDDITANSDITTLENLSANKLKDQKYIKIEQISAWLGARW